MIRAAHSAFGCHDPAGDSQPRRPQIEQRHMAVAPCPLPVNSSSPSLSPTARPSAGGPPPASARPPCCCRGAAARSIEPKLGFPPPPGTFAASLPLERRAEAGSGGGDHFRRPPCRPSSARTPSSADGASFTLFRPRRCSGLTPAFGRALHSSSHSSFFAHSRRKAGHGRVPPHHPDGSLGRALAGAMSQRSRPQGAAGPTMAQRGSPRPI
jgi:hypothetical protein